MVRESGIVAIMRSAPGRASASIAALTLFVASLAAQPPGEPRILTGVASPMRDGVMLLGDIFLPARPGRYPVILELTPYGRGPEGINFRTEAPYWTKRGYAFAVFDTRGQGGSGGSFRFMRDGEDGYDLVEWLARQPWSSGAVGMMGASYTGTNQWRTARERPPALKCITPAAVWHDPFQVIPYAGGAFASRWALSWPAQLSDSGIDRARRPDWEALLRHRPLRTADELAYGKPLRLFRELLDHPAFDEYWRARVLLPEDFSRIAVPALMFTGYLDEMHPGTISSFREMQARSPARDRQFLVVGPWEHITVVDAGLDYRDNYRPARRVRNLNLPDQAFLDSKDIYGRFFDWCLSGGPRFEQAPVRIYLTGSNRWLDLPKYPPPAARATPLYLSSSGRANGLRGDGRLTWSKPAGRTPDRYLFSPLDPGGPRRGNAGDPVDLRGEIDRADVLVYVTEPLPRSVTVAGNVRLLLHAATDGRDTDWVARVEDVAPDGTAIRIGASFAAIVRARYRNGFNREELLVPNRSYAYTLDLHEIGHTFQPGHRLRLSISSAAYPWIHPNPNTGNPIATDTLTPRKAAQTVFHDPQRPSRLVLPVLPEP